MEDHTDEAPLDDPANSASENPSGEFIPPKAEETINPIQETENMEVHHHSHAHGKKNWKSYLWEFLMLFLAVFCGFLAEYQLEHTIEHNRETDFIKSMIEDAQTDTANIHASISLNKKRALKMDSLAQLCFNYDATKNHDASIYKFYRAALTHPDLVSPAERTLSQLKNSGGMRLIRKKSAVDRITIYDDAGKKIKDQQEFYELLQYELGKHAFELFNFKNYSSDKYSALTTSPKLLNNDKVKLIVFGNMVVVYGEILGYYNKRLQQMDEDAVSLINTLRKEYDIE
jgi:hypothetical protein